LTNIADFNETIYDLMRADNLIDWDLLERFKRTAFGIPKTNLALIHGISQVVPRPEFKIFDLTQEIEVVGTIYSSGNYDIIYELLSKIIGESFTKYTSED
jgi:mannitol operon transcriptional antiterminator